MVELLRKEFKIGKNFEVSEYDDMWVFDNGEVGIDVYKSKEKYYEIKEKNVVEEREKMGIKVIGGKGYGYYDYRN